MRQNKGGNVRSGSHEDTDTQPLMVRVGVQTSNQLEDDPPRTSSGKILVNLLTC